MRITTILYSYFENISPNTFYEKGILINQGIFTKKEKGITKKEFSLKVIYCLGKHYCILQPIARI